MPPPEYRPPCLMGFPSGPTSRCKTGVLTACGCPGAEGEWHVARRPCPDPVGREEQTRAVGHPGATHRSPCGPCGSAAAGQAAAVSAGLTSPWGCWRGRDNMTRCPPGSAEGAGAGNTRHLRGDQRLVPLVEETKVLGAAGLAGDGSVSSPQSLQAPRKAPPTVTAGRSLGPWTKHRRHTRAPRGGLPPLPHPGCRPQGPHNSGQASLPPRADWLGWSWVSGGTGCLPFERKQQSLRPAPAFPSLWAPYPRGAPGGQHVQSAICAHRTRLFLAPVSRQEQETTQPSRVDSEGQPPACSRREGTADWSTES